MKSSTVSETLTTIKHKKLTPEEIDERKSDRAMLIGAKAQHAMEFQMRLSRHLRSLGYRAHRVCAEVLREILFWEMNDAVIRRDFWMYRVYKCKDGCAPDSRGHCCWDAGGFSRSNMDTARRVLFEDLGLLEQRRWYGGKIYYRVNHRALFDFLAMMEGTHEDVSEDQETEITTPESQQDQHSGVCETSIPDCGFPTVSIQRDSTENNVIPTETTPAGFGEGYSPDGEEGHEPQQEPTSTAGSRETKPLSVGETIARYVHRELKQYHGYGLTNVEFSALVKDVNVLREYGHDGMPVYVEELYEVADILVYRLPHMEDGRAYPPRAPDNLMVMAYEAWSMGYDLTEV